MVFLAITSAGLAEAIALSNESPFPIWCGSDAIGEEEYQKLSGVDLSRFIYPLSGEPNEVIVGALETIAEHHPGENIWVESNVRT